MVPKDAQEFKVKSMVSGKYGMCIHRGFDGTLLLLSYEFKWKSMRSHLEKFVKIFIHCIFSGAGVVLPRLLASAMNGCPKKVLQMVFLYKVAGLDQRNLCMLLIDDFLSYLWIFMDIYVRSGSR